MKKNFKFLSVQIYLLFFCSVIYAQVPKFSAEDSLLIKKLTGYAEHYEKINNKMEASKMIDKIAFTYWKNDEKQKAQKLYLKSLENYKSLGEKSKEASTLTNLALIESDLRDFSKSIKYLEESIKLFAELKLDEHLSSNFKNLGIVYYKMKDFNSAIYNYFKAISAASGINDKKSINECYTLIAEAYKALGDNEKAKFYTEQVTENNSKTTLPADKKTSNKTNEKNNTTKNQTITDNSNKNNPENNKIKNNTKENTNTKNSTSENYNTNTGGNQTSENNPTENESLQENKQNSENTYNDIVNNTQENTKNTELTNIEKEQNLILDKKTEDIEKSKDDKVKNRKPKNTGFFIAAGILTALVIITFLIRTVYIASKNKKATTIKNKKENIIKIETQIATEIIPEPVNKTVVTVSETEKNYFSFIEAETALNQALPKSFISMYENSFESSFFAANIINGKTRIVLTQNNGNKLSVETKNQINNFFETNKQTEPEDILKSFKETIKTVNTDNFDYSMGICVIDKKRKKLRFAGANISFVVLQNNILKSINKNNESISNLKKNKFSGTSIDFENTYRFYMYNNEVSQAVKNTDNKFTDTTDLLKAVYRKSIAEQKKILSDIVVKENNKQALLIGFAV